MTAAASLVSVVIPVKDGADTLGELFSSLDRQRTSFDVEVVVVDSGSRDASREIARRHGARVLEIPPAKFNHGATRNYGIERCDGELICLLTQDATPASDDFLAQFAAAFDDARVAGAYGRQIPRPDCDVLTRRNLEGWLTGRLDGVLASLGDRDFEALRPSERYELCVFDNVCSALRRSAWEKIPFPRVAFGEDIHWGYRAIREGWTIAYVPGAAVHHSHRRSIAYEYERTRLAHRELNHLFGLATLPRPRDVARACVANLQNDLPYVWRQAPSGMERLRQLSRIAGLSIAGPLAQYQGIRDAQHSRPTDGGGG